MKPGRYCEICAADIPSLRAGEELCARCDAQMTENFLDHHRPHQSWVGERKCRVCNKPLPGNKYFYHSYCNNAEGESIDGHHAPSAFVSFATQYSSEKAAY